MRGRWLLGVVGLALWAGCGDSGGGGDVDGAVDGAMVDGRVVDARVIDAMSVVDAGPGNPGWAGCGLAADPFVDRTGAGDSRVVVHSGFTFSPNCMRVKRGQMVTLPVLMNTHPLRSAANNPANDIIDTNTAVSSVTFTLTALGTYGYHCGVHGTTTGGGMAGAIEVVP